MALAQESSSRLAELLGAQDAGFPKATEPRSFDFPVDHGPHPNYRNEWWYVTGNLDDEDGERFGFELTFFRFALAPTAPDSPSAWRTRQLYIAHLALTDVAGEQFFVAQRYSRGAVGLAGAAAAPLRVWIDDWSIRATDAGRWHLDAAADDFAIDLALEALRPPVLNGIDGLSQKSAAPGNASYYYSITRFATRGSVHVNGREHSVSGLSWLDREWSSSALAGDQAGWDWFALQLDDGTDLMFYVLRRQDGSMDTTSAGTLVLPDGSTRHLSHDEVQLEVTDMWTSPRGGTYPAGWSLRVPGQGLDLEIRPAMADQELVTTVRYWEGAVDVRGSATGRGYVELTGYAE